MQNDLHALPWSPGKFFPVENYLEAVGVMSALKAGVLTEAVRRPVGTAEYGTELTNRLAAIPEPEERQQPTVWSERQMN